MQFFKLEGYKEEKKSPDKNTGRREESGDKYGIMKDTVSFNNRLRDSAYLFLNDDRDDKITVGAIVRDCADVPKLISRFLKELRLELKDTFLEEITLNTLRYLLLAAERNNYIRDDEEVLDRFGLEKLNGKYYGSVGFGENMVDCCDKASVYAAADKLPSRNALLGELDRIYAGGHKKTVNGHPVHYLIRTDDADMRREMHRVLLRALYANGRIRNRRYCFVDFEPGMYFSTYIYDCLYKSNIGGTMIVRYSGGDETEDNYAGGERDMIETLCRMIKKYRNQVLTILCLPRECAKTREIFFENLGNISVIELKEDFMSGEEARDFLKVLAKDCGIRTDKTLFAMLEEGNGYLAPDLHRIFDNWYNNKLKTSVYPQYNDAAVTRRETAVRAEPKGSAYDELDRMIGLGEAKTVINRAVGYYKAQKLFADRGMKADRPAMHMVFTGNPGTAKTTVARLFARIMKENGLLSEGTLVEVGRGDLVAKYVGWTAPTIQKKFREAQGGVLFIDEAYSLVDDRSGSFGDEAINTIVQEMENHRNDVVVIFAGYPDKMEQFLRMNPGLRSRIAFHVPFSDYGTEDLCEIAELMAKQKGLTFTAEARNKLADLFDTSRAESDFGNGRYVRNVIEKAKMAQAARLLTMDPDSVGREDIATITADDIEMPHEGEKQKKKLIGFCA